MGLQELPNGMQYFNVSEELQIWTQSVISGFTPIFTAIIIISTIILVFIVIFATIYALKQGVSNGT